jgi:hypothetical protein
MSTLESPESYEKNDFMKELHSLQGSIENTGKYIKDNVQNIIEESIANSLSLPLNLPYIKESIVNYIVD